MFSYSHLICSDLFPPYLSLSHLPSSLLSLWLHSSNIFLSQPTSFLSAVSSRLLSSPLHLIISNIIKIASLYQFPFVIRFNSRLLPISSTPLAGIPLSNLITMIFFSHTILRSTTATSPDPSAASRLKPSSLKLTWLRKVK